MANTEANKYSDHDIRKPLMPIAAIPGAASGIKILKTICNRLAPSTNAALLNAYWD